VELSSKHPVVLPALPIESGSGHEGRQNGWGRTDGRAWTGLLASVISQVCSPPVLSISALTGVAVLLSEGRAWLLAGAFMLVAVLLPLSYLITLVRRGRVTDLDVQRREQRVRPMLFTLACGGLGWIVLAVASAPVPLLALTATLWLQLAIAFAITLRWKISVHCSSAAAVATAMGVLAGMPLLLAALPLIAWSRVRLRRHTVAQTIAGSLLGCAVSLVVLAWL
jgi:membrane-associated phospholipid phosphatase